MYTENQDKPSEARQNGNILHTDYVGLIAAFMRLVPVRQYRPLGYDFEILQNC